MVDLDKLETLLKVAALKREPLTYGEILRYFERRTTPITVRALCSDLGKVCRKLEAEGWPELACLVVRAADGLPGDGYFEDARDDRGRPVPAGSEAAVAWLRSRQEEAYRFAERLR